MYFCFKFVASILNWESESVLKNAVSKRSVVVISLGILLIKFFSNWF